MRRGFACVLLTVAALCLPACSDDPPKPPPTTTTAPSTTSAPSPTAPPPSPPPAKRTPAGAEAFVRYFWQTYNYAYATLNPQPLASISGKSCKFCTSTEQDVREIKDEGSRVRGAEIVVGAVVAPPDEIKQGTLVATVVEQKPGTTIKSTGEVEEIKGSPKRRSYVGIEWAQGSWTVFGVTLEKPGQ